MFSPLSAPRRLAALLIVLAASFLPATIAHAQTDNFPAQYVARLYTEGLGRMPDSGTWATDISYFQKNQCTQQTLAQLTTQASGMFYGNTGTDFTDHNVTVQAQIIAMYRAILNRDPDVPGYNTYYAGMTKTNPWTILEVAQALYGYDKDSQSYTAGTEFANLSNAICGVYSNNYNVGSFYANGGTGGYIADYNNPALPADPVNNPEFPVGTAPYFVSTPVGCTPGQTTSPYCDITNFNIALNAAQSGQTVYLAPESVIEATSTIIIKPGVTVATSGVTDYQAYTHMARIVRATQFDGPLIQLGNGATVEYLWIDGQRNHLLYDKPNNDRPNISVSSGSSESIVQYNKITNPQGGTSVFAYGTGLNGTPCGSSTTTGLLLNNNVVTGYATNHAFPQTDGNGAVVTASINTSNHTVQSFTVSQTGSSYPLSPAPSVVLAGGGGSGATATAVINYGSVTSVSLSGSTATVNITLPSEMAAPTMGQVVQLYGFSSANSFLNNQSFTVLTATGNSFTGKLGTTGTISSPSNGSFTTNSVVAVNVGSSGSGYTSAPTVSIVPAWAPVGPADGFTVQCESSIIKNNQLVDVTDDGVVLFGEVTTANPIVTQHSTVEGNYIITAGNSMNAGISTDELTAINEDTLGTDPQQYVCFTGTSVTGNFFFSGPDSAFDFPLDLGDRPFGTPQRLWSSSCPNNTAGPTYSNNTTPSGVSANAQEGIMVDGMDYVSITEGSPWVVNINNKSDSKWFFAPNSSTTPHFPGTPAYWCPNVAFALDKAQYTGTLPSGYTNESLDFCTYKTP